MHQIISSGKGVPLKWTFHCKLHHFTRCGLEFGSTLRHCAKIHPCSSQALEEKVNTIVEVTLSTRRGFRLGELGGLACRGCDLESGSLHFLWLRRTFIHVGGSRRRLAPLPRTIALDGCDGAGVPEITSKVPPLPIPDRLRRMRGWGAPRSGVTGGKWSVPYLSALPDEVLVIAAWFFSHSSVAVLPLVALHLPGLWQACQPALTRVLP